MIREIEDLVIEKEEQEALKNRLLDALSKLPPFRIKLVVPALIERIKEPGITNAEAARRAYPDDPYMQRRAAKEMTPFKNQLGFRLGPKITKKFE